MRASTSATTALGTFVMPHFGDTPLSGEHLRLAIQSVVEQTEGEPALAEALRQLSPSEVAAPDFFARA